LAKAIDINASRLSRALNGTDTHSFNIENCLRLAKLSGEPASEVLRAAGKGEIAELIESLYGKERPVTDPVVQDLLKNWATFTADEKNHVRSTVTMVLRARASADGGQRENVRETPTGKSSKAKTQRRRETAATEETSPPRRLISFEDEQTDGAQTKRRIDEGPREASRKKGR